MVAKKPTPGASASRQAGIPELQELELHGCTHALPKAKDTPLFVQPNTRFCNIASDAYHEHFGEELRLLLLAHLLRQHRGHSWLTQQVPPDVLQELRRAHHQLPGTAPAARGQFANEIHRHGPARWRTPISYMTDTDV